MIDVEKLSKELEDRFSDVQFEVYDDCVEIDFDDCWTSEMDKKVGTKSLWDSI